MQIQTKINGQMALFGIFGHPVKHSFSPILQNTLAALLGENAVYVPFPVPPEGLEAAVKGAFALGVQGLNITIPHKQAILPFLAGIDPLAERIGAVNTLCRRENGFWGYNTDVLGLKKCFSLHHRSLKGERVLLIGAGGAANAAAFLAAEEGADAIWIANRTLAKAQALSQRVRQWYPLPVHPISLQDIPHLEGPLLVIQTTSVGMERDESPVLDPSFWQKVPFVVDIIYTPWQTRTLREARAQGAEGVNGFEMLIYQGIASAELWRNIQLSPHEAQALYNALALYYREGQA